jgi:hypothetical protein
MNHMNEKISFEGFVYVSNVLLPQITLQKTDKNLVNFIQIKKTGTFKIFVNFENKSVSIIQEELFYQFFINGKLSYSSVFPQQNPLEFRNIRISGQKSTKEFNKEFSIFEFKIFDKDPSKMNDNSIEFFNLKFHVFNESIWKIDLMKPKNPILEIVFNYFKVLVSKFSLQSYQIKESTPHSVVSVICKFDKLIVNFKNQTTLEETLILDFTKILQIKFHSNSFEMLMSNLKRLKFNFEVKLKNEIEKYFLFVQFVQGKSFIIHESQEINTDPYFSGKFPFSEDMDFQRTRVGYNVKSFCDVKRNYQPSSKKLSRKSNLICEEHLPSIPEISHLDTESIQNSPSVQEISLNEFKKAKEIKETNQLSKEHFQKNPAEIPQGDGHSKKESKHKSFIYVPNIQNIGEVSEVPLFLVKNSTVSSWSVENVCQWIRRIGSVYEDKKYDSIFRENGIDGIALINMDKSDLKKWESNSWEKESKSCLKLTN